ncbi:MAG: hypothetical protein AAFO29_11535, partial [Actinomycetota bacterium]
MPPSGAPAPSAPPQQPPTNTPGVATPAAVPRRRRTVALAAVGSFVLGGAVGIGGFAAGQRVADDGSTTEPTVVTTLAPVQEDADRSSGQAEPATPTTTELTGDEPVAVVARAVGPSVVQVETTIGQGSGVVYD